jgi:outer membrane protein assembly factor BamD
MNNAPLAGVLGSMTKNRIGRRLAPALIAALFLPACAVFKKDLPLTPEMAYVRGMAAYQARHYTRSADLIKRWVDANSAGDPRMPQALLAVGTSHIHTGEYLTAASELLRLITDYPQQAEQQEARYRLCDAYHHLSPRAQLDQQYTETAITYCQSFAEYYGQTPQADTVRAWVKGMRDKMAYKSYLNGMFYLKRGATDAAVIYFNDTANGYPDTPWAPAALARLVETYRKINYREEAEEARQRLLRDFPQSDEARQLAAAPAPADSAARAGSAAVPPAAPTP